MSDVHGGGRGAFPDALVRQGTVDNNVSDLHGRKGEGVNPVMKRSEKRVLTAILNKPMTLQELYVSVRLSRSRICEALESLMRSGDVERYGDSYRICSQRPVSKLVLRDGKLVEECGERLLRPAVVVKDKPIAEWLKNPPQPLPRHLQEPKTRRRDREWKPVQNVQQKFSR